MRKSIWIRIVSILLIIALTGCSAPTMGPVDSQPQTDSSTTSTTGQEDETTGSTDATENTEDPSDPTTDTETEPKEELSSAQKNAIAMLYHLATTTEEICISKNNRVILEDIYTALLNEINPGAIDETTQDHLENIRRVIGDFLNIQSKREQLQYIYNQQKAAAMKEAVPDPLAILSMTNSLNWKKLAINVVYTVVDSYANYKSANNSADHEFFLSGWELDDKEMDVVRKNRDSAFDYMTDIVQQYGSEEDKKALGKLTLNEKAITDFAEICAIDEVYRKIERLTSKEETYKLFGNYWLELADCYFEIENYEKCLECVKKYNELEIDIFRKDFNIVPILPKAITAARAVYTGDEYIQQAKAFADAIIENANDDEWSVRYFAAQTYMDLFAKTNNREYLETAYKIIKENVTVLIEEQNNLNKAYFADVQKATLDEKQAKKLNDKEKKAEQKRIDAYNDALEDARKKELPPLYEPLVLNCDLLFALAEKMDIDDSAKTTISSMLQTEKGGIFLSSPVNNKYRFNAIEANYTIDLSKESIVIPANLLTPCATITITVTAGSKTTTLDDFEIKEVKREGNSVDTFKAEYTSKKLQDYKWSADATIKIEIINGNYCSPVILNYKVKEYKDNWIFPDSVTFEQL